MMTLDTSYEYSIINHSLSFIFSLLFLFLLSLKSQITSLPPLSLFLSLSLSFILFKQSKSIITKGGLWTVDSMYRESLLAALKLNPYHPYHKYFTPPYFPRYVICYDGHTNTCTYTHAIHTMPSVPHTTKLNNLISRMLTKSSPIALLTKYGWCINMAVLRV